MSILLSSYVQDLITMVTTASPCIPVGYHTSWMSILLGPHHHGYHCVTMYTIGLPHFLNVQDLITMVTTVSPCIPLTTLPECPYCYLHTSSTSSPWLPLCHLHTSWLPCTHCYHRLHGSKCKCWVMELCVYVEICTGSRLKSHSQATWDTPTNWTTWS